LGCSCSGNDTELQQTDDSPDSKRRRLRQELLQELPSVLVAAEGDSTDALKQEVVSYYNTTASCYSDDALSFWKDNQCRFPILSQIAALYLVTSASSVPVESLFSTTGLVLNSRRSSLKPDKLNKTVFMHDNFQLIADYASYVAVPGNAQEVTQVEPEPTPGHSSWQ